MIIPVQNAHISLRLFKKLPTSLYLSVRIVKRALLSGVLEELVLLFDFRAQVFTRPITREALLKKRRLLKRAVPVVKTSASS